LLTKSTLLELLTHLILSFTLPLGYINLIIPLIPIFCV